MIKDNLPPKIYQNQDEKICNRHVNMTYVLAGVLQQAFKDMEKYLNFTNSGLRFSNKQILIDIQKLLKRFIVDVDALQEASILKLDEDTQYQHEKAIHQYYSFFLRLSEIAGATDAGFNLRMYILYTKLNKEYNTEFTFPSRELQDHLAFDSVASDIVNKVYTDEDIDNAFEMDKDEGRA